MGGKCERARLAQIRGEFYLPVGSAAGNPRARPAEPGELGHKLPWAHGEGVGQAADGVLCVLLDDDPGSASQDCLEV
jgi:hypothetical protein